MFPAMSVSTVRREAVELLCAAQADGRISVELFESRLAAVQEATSDAAIHAIVADLVEEEPAGPPMAVDGSGAAVPVDDHLRLTAVLGTTRREGNWVVPWNLAVLGLLGEVNLDFRDAYLPDDVIDVEVASTLASVVLIVPPGTTVQNDCDEILSSTETKRKGRGKARAAPNGLTLRVHGRLILSSLEIREK